MMAGMKTLFAWMLSGAITGVVVSTFLARGFLTWYNTPGGTAQALCNCTDVVRATAESLVDAQLIGGMVGSVLFLIVGILIMNARRNKAGAPVAPVAPGPSPQA
jgi:hypothetical protein